MTHMAQESRGARRADIDGEREGGGPQSTEFKILLATAVTPYVAAR